METEERQGCLPGAVMKSANMFILRRSRLDSSALNYQKTKSCVGLKLLSGEDESLYLSAPFSTKWLKVVLLLKI